MQRVCRDADRNCTLAGIYHSRNLAIGIVGKFHFCMYLRTYVCENKLKRKRIKPLALLRDIQQFCDVKILRKKLYKKSSTIAISRDTRNTIGNRDLREMYVRTYVKDTKKMVEDSKDEEREKTSLGVSRERNFRQQELRCNFLDSVARYSSCSQ